MGWKEDLERFTRNSQKEMRSHSVSTIRDYFIPDEAMDKKVLALNKEKGIKHTFERSIFQVMCIYQMVREYTGKPEGLRDYIHEILNPNSEMKAKMAQMGQQVYNAISEKGDDYVAEVLYEGAKLTMPVMQELEKSQDVKQMKLVGSKDVADFSALTHAFFDMSQDLADAFPAYHSYMKKTYGMEEAQADQEYGKFKEYAIVTGYAFTAVSGIEDGVSQIRKAFVGDISKREQEKELEKGISRCMAAFDTRFTRQMVLKIQAGEITVPEGMTPGAYATLIRNGLSATAMDQLKKKLKQEILDNPSKAINFLQGVMDGSFFDKLKVDVSFDKETPEAKLNVPEGDLLEPVPEKAAPGCLLSSMKDIVLAEVPLREDGKLEGIDTNFSVTRTFLPTLAVMYMAEQFQGTQEDLKEYLSKIANPDTEMKKKLAEVGKEVVARFRAEGGSFVAKTLYEGAQKVMPVMQGFSKSEAVKSGKLFGTDDLDMYGMLGEALFDVSQELSHCKKELNSYLCEKENTQLTMQQTKERQDNIADFANLYNFLAPSMEYQCLHVAMLNTDIDPKTMSDEEKNRYKETLRAGIMESFSNVKSGQYVMKQLENDPQMSVTEISRERLTVKPLLMMNPEFLQWSEKMADAAMEDHGKMKYLVEQLKGDTLSQNISVDIQKTDMDYEFVFKFPDIDKQLTRVREQDKPENVKLYNEMRRLALQMKKTDQLFSKGSTSYQEFRKAIDVLIKNEKAPDGFDVKETLEKIVAQGRNYKSEHAHMNLKKLSDTQLQRLKIMRRFEVVNRLADQKIQIDSVEAKQELLAEKVVDTLATRMIKNNADLKGLNKKILLGSDVYYYNSVKSLKESDAFKGLTEGAMKGLENIDKALHTKGDDFLDKFSLGQAALLKEKAAAEAAPAGPNVEGPNVAQAGEEVAGPNV